MKEFVNFIILEYASLVFGILFISSFMMTGYLAIKGLFKPFQLTNEYFITYPFLFRDYVKHHNKALLTVYYIFITSGILLFLIFMTSFFSIVIEEAHIVIQYIVIGSVVFFSSIIGLVIYGLSKEKYYFQE